MYTDILIISSLVFCLNNCFLLVFVINYVHLGFMLHLMFFNLIYLCVMCVTMMVFWICVHLLYFNIYCSLWILVMNSNSPCLFYVFCYDGYQYIIQVQNRVAEFNSNIILGLHDTPVLR